jgi:translation initiation factor eIF-2B subunit epsilon
MSNKKQKEASTQIFDQVDQLQAIVILETYTNRSQPLSDDTAECLMPVLGKPLIDYTVEYLIENSVDDIQLYFTRHSKAIIGYITGKLKTSWSTYSKIIKYNVIKSDSFGETMRCIYNNKNSDIRKTFVLVTTPGLITNNICLKAYFDAHIQRLIDDKNLLITFLCTQRSTHIGLKSLDETLIVHDAHNCIRFYDKQINASRGKTISIPKNVMDCLTRSTTIDGAKKATGGIQQTTGGAKSSATLQLRTDLVDASIFICQHAIIQEFDDNFDALTLNELIKQLLQNEISGHTIYFDIVQAKFGAYLACVRTLNDYYIENMKLLQRYHLASRYKSNAYVDTVGGSTLKTYSNLINVYLDAKSTKLGKNVQLKRNVFIDVGCSIGTNTNLVNCYLGRNCAVGDNVSLSNCIVLDNTHVADKVVANGCILGANVRIGANSRICENTLFGNKCVVDADTTIDKPGVFHVEEEDDFDGDEEGTDECVVRHESAVANYVRFNPNRGAHFDSSESEDVDSDDEHNTAKATDSIENKFYFYIWPYKTQFKKIDPMPVTDAAVDTSVYDDNDSSSLSMSDDDDASECSKNEDEFDGDEIALSDNNYEEDEEDLDDDEKAFLNELNETLKRYLREKQNADNIVLEINGCKHASYVQIDDLCTSLIRALLKFPHKNSKFLLKFNAFTDKSTYLDKCKFLFKWYKDLVAHYLNITKKTKLLFCTSLADFFLAMNDKQFIDQNLIKLFHYLNQELEILNEESILSWHASQMKTQVDKTSLKYHLLVKLDPFIKWLNEADEESVDEDDDDNDED